MIAPLLDFRNLNALWGSVLVEVLARCGVKMAVVSPGSRSTPLTIALTRKASIELVPVLDERSAAFFALGAARRLASPVALVCTSGTAAANFLPAIIEAHEGGVPLLVFTADRPPELRACASGQTIDQQKIYGGYVSFYHELALPEPKLETFCYLRQTVAHACRRAQHPQAGPVHVNVPLRDPLAPVEDASAAGLRGKIDEAFFAHLDANAAEVSRVAGWQRPTTARGLIVAGPAIPRDPAAYAQAVRALAEGLGWPVLADALSPLRHHGEAGVPIVTAYDSLLRDAHAAQTLLPKNVVCLGGWPTSKTLRTWLERSQAEILLVAETEANRDALHARTRQLAMPVESLRAEGAPIRDEAYLRAWSSAQAAAGGSLRDALAANEGQFEGKAAWLLGQHLPAGTPVFVASSMPVRDVEYFWPLNDRRCRLFFNRGANGIDGTLSSALGVAHEGVPTVLLTGDLALLHDTNGFLLHKKFHGSLTVVLINNRGGGIFEHLPVAKFDPPFEEFFATPQEVDFARLCSAYQVGHQLIENWAALIAAIEKLPPRGVRVLEIRTDRKRDAATRKQLFAAAAAAAGRVLA